MPEFKVERVDPRSLKFNPKNFKRHTEQQLEAIAQSIHQFGWVKPILVSKKTRRVLNGHGRLEVALDKGMETVPVHFVAVSVDQEDRILLMFDRTGDLAETDAEKLLKLVEGVINETEYYPPGYDESYLSELAALIEDSNEGMQTTDEGPSDAGYMDKDLEDDGGGNGGGGGGSREGSGEPSHQALTFHYTIPIHEKLITDLTRLSNEWGYDGITQTALKVIELAAERHL